LGADDLGDLFGPFFSSIVIGTVFLAVETALTRSFDVGSPGGFAAFIASARSS